GGSNVLQVPCVYRFHHSGVAGDAPPQRGGIGGLGRNRTGVCGFAVRCMSTLPPGRWRAPRITIHARGADKQSPGGAGALCKLERETRLELATSTLARLRSTN